MPRAALGLVLVLSLATIGRAQEPAADGDRELTSLVERGQALTKEGKLDEAGQALTRAQAIVDQGLGLDHPAAGAVLEALTRLRLAQDDTNAAFLAVGQRVEASERRLRRSLAGSSPAARLALAREAQALLDDYLQVAIKAGYSGYPTVLRFKGVVGRWARTDRSAARGITAEERTRRESLASATSALAKLLEAPPGDDAAAWRASITTAQARHDELLRDLAARSPIQREAETWLRAGVREVQAALRDTDALVDVVASQERYTAWVLRPKKAPARVDLGPVQAMNDACAGLLKLLRGPSQGIACDLDALDAAVRTASDVVWRPLETAVADATVIYLVPDGALAAMPFALLETSKKRPLLETRTVVHLETAQDLVAWRDGRSPGRGMVGIGGVDLGAAPDGVAAVFSSTAAGDVADVRSLTAAFREVYPDELGRVVEGAQATETALRALSSGRRVLHLATPAFARLELRGDDAAVDTSLDPSLDPMQLAGVALAGANTRASSGDDGIFTALEAAELDLGDCDLVVLSPCDTADDGARAGAGVLALARGFRTAGARNVLTTLWPPSEGAAAVFMLLFYERWLGRGEGGRRSAPVAAREAALAVRELVVEVDVDGVRELQRPFEDPVYWAPFVVYGPVR